MGNFADLANTGITALAGGGKTGATALGYGINIVSVCATAGDSVLLPAALPGGQIVTIINNGAAALQVYGSGTDTINSVATGTGIVQNAGSITSYYCTTAETPTAPSSTQTAVSAGNWQTSATSKTAFSLLSASAVTLAPKQNTMYQFTRAGVVTVTLTAPVAGTDDGVEIGFTNTTTDQDVINSTGSKFQTGGTAVATATFPAHAGGTLVLQAYNGFWQIKSNNLVVMS